MDNFTITNAQMDAGMQKEADALDAAETKTYRTPADDAKSIRTELKKEHGWTSRQVSVRSESYSMGSSINIMIKDATVNAETVERVANQAEKIHRCSVSGEILSGGNRFVFVRFSHEVEEAMADQFETATEKAVAEVDADERSDSVLIPVDGTELLVGRDMNHNGLISIWSTGAEGHWLRNACTVRGAASFIGLNTVGQ